MKITCPVCGNETEQPRCEQCGYAICSDVMADVVTTKLLAELMRISEQQSAQLQAQSAQLQALQKAVQDLSAQIQSYNEAEQERQRSAAQAKKLAAFKKAGSIVQYGQYPQDADGTKQPIEWIVLAYDAEKNQATLLSRYGLEAKAFHHEKPYPTWEKSDIRAWLNGEFLNKAFSAEEQKRVVTAKLSTPDYVGESGGADTEDRVWLLSREEATKYFKDDGARETTATDYANTHGAFKADNECCWWWLRSPGISGDSVSYVSSGGSLYAHYVIRASNVARPAFILNLGSL